MKAREIIPGWPRGRSTSRPMRYNRKIAAFFVTDRFFINESPFFDHGRAALEWADRAIEADEIQDEERRKAAMMEVYWAEQRILARGPLYPQPLSERMFGFYGVGFQIDPQILAQLEAVNEAANLLCGGFPTVEPKERDGR